MSVHQLLVVEDDPVWRERLSETARSEGCEVALAADGAEALSYLSDSARARPNLVLLDLMLPRLDGWELYGRMRTDRELRHIPVLMMSVASQNVDLSGVVGFLHKTASADAVLTELRGRLRSLETPAPATPQTEPYGLQLTEEAAILLGTLPPRLCNAMRLHLYRAAELAGRELPLMSTWLMALPGDPPSMLVTVDGVRAVLEVDDEARKLIVTTLIAPPHLPRT